VHGEVAVEVDDERVAGHQHGVDLQVIELHVIACGGGGLGEDLTEQIGGVDLHLLRQLAAEKRNQEEVEFLGRGELFDAGVAEADGFALRVGDDGDVCFRGEAHAEASGADVFSEPSVCLKVNPDAVVLERHFGLGGVDIAGGVPVAADVEAVVFAGEDLGVEDALESLCGDLDFDGARGGAGGEEHAYGCEMAKLHALQDNGDWTFRISVRYTGCRCGQIGSWVWRAGCG
jgi:hypothetical protein